MPMRFLKGVEDSTITQMADTSQHTSESVNSHDNLKQNSDQAESVRLAMGQAPVRRHQSNQVSLSFFNAVSVYPSVSFPHLPISSL